LGSFFQKALLSFSLLPGRLVDDTMDNGDVIKSVFFCNTTKNKNRTCIRGCVVGPSQHIIEIPGPANHTIQPLANVAADIGFTVVWRRSRARSTDIPGRHGKARASLGSGLAVDGFHFFLFCPCALLGLGVQPCVVSSAFP
jgi:hypothetical protein